MFGESQGLSVPGAGPGMDEFFEKINSQAAFSGDVVQAASSIVSHQAGGELKISDAGLNNTGQGLSSIAPSNTPIFKPVGMIGGQGTGHEQ